MRLRLEVFGPGSKQVTIRLSVPSATLRALAERGLGQIFLRDDTLHAACGVGELILAVDRIGDPRTDPSNPGLREGVSAHGDPKLEGVVVGSAGGAWWETADGHHADQRRTFVEAVMKREGWLPSLTFGLQDKIRRLLGEAFDEGAGRGPR